MALTVLTIESINIVENRIKFLLPRCNSTYYCEIMRTYNIRTSCDDKYRVQRSLFEQQSTCKSNVMAKRVFTDEISNS